MNAPIMPLRGVRKRAVFPRPIRTLVRKLPRVPSSAVVAAVLNLMMRRRLPLTFFEKLGDRPFTVEVRDPDLVMAFRCVGRRFFPVPWAGDSALRFRVNASDFATLAAPPGSAEEGCCLRDLVVVGDPDIAREVHQTLAGIDIPRTRRILRRAVRMAEREVARR